MDTGTTDEKTSYEIEPRVRYEEAFKRLEARIHEAFRQHKERINQMRELLLETQKKTQHLDPNHPFTILMNTISLTAQSIFLELTETNRLIENAAMGNLAAFRDGFQNREMIRNFAFEMAKLAPTDEKLREYEQRIRQLVTDADTKYKEPIEFLEKMNKQLDEQEKKSEEQADYVAKGRAV